MNIKEVMSYKTFVVCGNTIQEDKYAFKIKNALLEAGYNVFSVGKELSSINDVNEEIDIIDLCINSTLGLKLLKENKKAFKMIIIQPGAESEELISYLKENDLPFMEACILVGLSLIKK